jgi:ABC-type glycerol-3-phosphate transport system substrate-binding protein
MSGTDNASYCSVAVKPSGTKKVRLGRTVHKLLAAVGASVATIAATVLPSTSASASSPVTITFLNTGASPQVLSYFDDTVIPGFEKASPGINVQMSSVAWGSSFTKIETGVVAGTADDVMLLGNIFLPVLASKHGLYPLTKFVKGWAAASCLL